MYGAKNGLVANQLVVSFVVLSVVTLQGGLPFNGNRCDWLS